ncbi:hypothetical protein Tco_0013798 [Tanacetum coccineum]
MKSEDVGVKNDILTPGGERKSKIHQISETRNKSSDNICERKIMAIHKGPQKNGNNTYRRIMVKKKLNVVTWGETLILIRIGKRHPIWEVIQNGNGPVSITTDTQGQIKVLPPRTAKEIIAKEKERKARTTLLMALPKDHLGKSRFGGNDESKKMQKYSLKQHFDVFSEQLDEYDLEEMDLKWQVAMISMRIKKFYKKTGRKLQFDAKEPVSFDKTKVECYNCHKTWNFARECRIKGNQDNRRRDAWNSRNKDGSRTRKKEDSKALVTLMEKV